MKHIFIAVLLLALTWSPASADRWNSMRVSIEVSGVNDEPAPAVAKRLARAMDKIDVIVEEGSSLVLQGELAIEREQEIPGGFSGSQFLVNNRLDLAIVDRETGNRLATAVFYAKGMDNDRARAIRASYRKFTFPKDELATFYDRAQQRLIKVMEEANASLLEEGEALYGRKKRDQALNVLASIDKSSASYPAARSLIDKIKEEQWVIWQDSLEHERKMMEETTRQDSIRVDSLRQEKEKALAEAQKVSDSLAIVKAVGDSIKASLEIERSETEHQRLQVALKQAEAKAESLRIIRNLVEQQSNQIIREQKKAEQERKKNRDTISSLTDLITGGVAKLSDSMARFLGRKNIELPEELVGQWQSSDCSIDIRSNGDFTMNTPSEPKYIHGYVAVVKDGIMVLCAENQDIDEKNKNWQVRYKIERSGSLVIAAASGFVRHFVRG